MPGKSSHKIKYIKKICSSGIVMALIASNFFYYVPQVLAEEEAALAPVIETQTEVTEPQTETAEPEAPEITTSTDSEITTSVPEISLPEVSTTTNPVTESLASSTPELVASTTPIENAASTTPIEDTLPPLASSQAYDSETATSTDTSIEFPEDLNLDSIEQIFRLQASSTTITTETAELTLPENLSSPIVVSYKNQRDSTALEMYVLNLTPQSILFKEGENFFYEDVFTNTDLKYEVTPNGIKESIIIKEGPHPPQFQYSINLDEFDTRQISANRIALYKKGDDNSLSKLYTLSAPNMTDASGRRSENISLSFSGNTLTVTPDPVWLSEAVFPVVIDPTIEVTVLNVHSHPVEGEYWNIDFTTVGTADLTIRPADDATVKDMRFEKLTCGSEDRTESVVKSEQGVLSYPQWSCDEIARASFLDLHTGDHTMEFDFANATETAVTYAYNTNRTWTGNGADSNWSTAANWSGNTVPTASDVAVFDSSCTANCNPTLSANVNVGGISIATTSTATITQSGSYTVTVGGYGYIQSGGTFVGGSGILDINGAFYIEGGTFTPSSATTSVSRGFTYNGGTFNGSGKKLALDGVSSGTLTCTGDFNSLTNIGLVVVDKTSGIIFTLASGCDLTADMSNAGTDIIVQSGATLNVTGNWSSLSLNNSGTINMPSASSIAISNFTNNTGATMTYAGSSVLIKGNYTNNGTFDITGKTLTFGGTSSGTLTCAGNFNTSTAVGSVVIDKTSGISFTLGSGCTLTADLSQADTGIVVQNGATLTATGNWKSYSINNSGTINMPSATSLDITENLTNNLGATITYAGTPITITGAWTQNGTFDITGKTLTFARGDAAVLNCTGDFNATTGVASVTINKPSSTSFTLSSGCTVAAEVNTDSTMTVSSGATLNVTGNWKSYSLTNSGTINLPSATSFDINGSFTNNTGATISYAGTNITVLTNWTQSGTFDLTGKTLTLDGSASGTFNCTGNFNTTSNVSSVVVNKTAGTFTLNSGCAITADINLTGSVSVNSSATLIATGNWVSRSVTNSGVIDLPAATSFTINGSLINNIGGTINYSGTNISIGANWTQDGTFDLSGKNLSFIVDATFTDSAFNCSGDFNETTEINSVTVSKHKFPSTYLFTLNSGCGLAATISGGRITVNSDAVLTAVGNWDSGPVTNYGTIVADNATWSSGDITNSGTVTLNSATASIGALINSNGAIFNGSSGTLTVGANWANAGTFGNNGGTVVLANVNHTISGSTVFNNLSMTDLSTGRTLTFEVGSTQTILGTLTLSGGSGKVLSLRSDVPGTAWNIDPQGARTVSYVNVQDSNNTNVSTIYAGTGSTDSLRNTNWAFTTQPPLTPSSLGPVDVVNGGATSTQPSFTFNLTDPDAADQIKYHIQVDDSLDFLSPVIDYLSPLLPQGVASFTVGQAAGAGSYIVGQAGQLLSDLVSYFWRVLGIDSNNASSGWATANNGSAAFSVSKYRTVTWDGGAGTVNWSDAANWDTDQVPGVDDDVVIPNANVTLAATTTIHSFNYGTTGSKTLTINNNVALVVTATTTLTDGSVNTGYLKPQGDVVVVSTFDGGSSTLYFNGSTDQNFDLTGASDKFNGNVIIAKSGGAVTLLSDLTMDAFTQSFTIKSGTFNQGANTLSVASDFSQSGGIFIGSADNAKVLDINGHFSLTGGDFTSAATTTLQYNFTFSGGTFNGSGSRLILDGNLPTTFTCAGDFNTVTGISSVALVKGGSGNTFTLSSGCTLAADMSNTGGDGSYITVNSGATLSATGNWKSSTLTNSGTVNLPNATVFDINLGSLINNTGAAINYAGTNITIDKNWTQNGIFDLTGKVLAIDGNISSIFNCTGDFNASTDISSVALVKGGSGNTFTLSSGCTLAADMSNTGGDGSYITVNSGATLSATGNWKSSTLTNSGTVNLPNATVFDINLGSLINNTGAAINYAGTNITINQNWTQSGTFELTGKSLTFDGNMDTAFNCTGDFNTSTDISSVALVKAGPGNTFTLSSGCTLAADMSNTRGSHIAVNPGAALTGIGSWSSGTVTNSGTLTAPSGTMTLSGNFTNTGTFNHNSGTLIFTGNASHAVSGSTTFNNLTMTGLDIGRTLTFAAGSTQTVLGTLNLTGGSGKVLSLRSDVPGTAWNIDPQGARTVSYVNVQDSNNTNTATIYAGAGSTDSLRNTNWAFTSNPPAAPSSLGSASVVSGGWIALNQPTVTFTLSDPNGADTVKFQIQIDDTANFSSPLISYTSALAAQGASSFAVGQAAGSGTYAVGEENQTLPDSSSGYYWRVRAIDVTGFSSGYTSANSGAVAFKVDSTAPAAGSLSGTAVSASSITVSISGASDSGSGLSTTPYIFYNQTATTDSGATAETSWPSLSLLANTQYTFLARVTDEVGNYADTATLSIYTSANVPASVTATAGSATSVTVAWDENGNSNGTEYFVRNVTLDTDSGWITGASHTFTGLTCETQYAFTVKARNAELTETAETDSATVTTAACPVVPPPVTPGDSTPADPVPTPGGHHGGNGNGGSGSTPGGNGNNGGSGCINLLPPEAIFTHTLNKNSKGEDVKTLQKFLNKNGFLIAESGPGSPGEETTKFGSLTEEALAKFQFQFASFFKLKGKEGRLDPETREFINSLLTEPQILCPVATAEEPQTPVTPENPAVPETPEVPSVPEIPETPPITPQKEPPSTPVSEIIAEAIQEVIEDANEGVGQIVNNIVYPALQTSSDVSFGISKVVVEASKAAVETAKDSHQKLASLDIDPEVSAWAGTLTVAPSVLFLQYSLGTQTIVINSIGSLADVWYLLAGFFQGLLASVGLRARRRYWGTVYDSRTKQPIDPAIVELLDADSGKVLETSITDLAGRFGFLDKQGKYRIRAKKTHYAFPSAVVTGQSDSIFENVYHGEIIEIKSSDDLLTPNIPMDALAFDWNQWEKQKTVKFHPTIDKVIQTILNIVFWAGFVFVLTNLLVNYNFINGVFALSYIALIVIKNFIPSQKLWGKIESSSKEVSGLMLELSHIEIPSVVVARTITNNHGKFFLKTSKGNYILKVKKINGSNLDTLLETKLSIGSEGVLNSTITV